MEGLIIVLLLVFIAILIVPMVFFLLQLQKLLKTCSPENRKMEPGMVWLNLIPLFSLGWIFYTIIQIRDTLKLEFHTRSLETDNPEFHFPLGLTYAILNACSFVLGWIPILGWMIGIAGLVLFIMYWIKMYNYTSILLNSNN